jgi:hypothetical protein
MIREIEKFENAARLAMGSYDIASPVHTAKAVPGPNLLWMAALAALAGAALLCSFLL